MKRQHLALVGVVGLFAGLLAACGGEGSSAEGSSDDTIKVGTIYPITGDLGPSGTAALQGHELAVKEINEAGGIESLGGRKLELVNGDSRGEPSQGVTESVRVIDQGAVTVVGAFQSAVTLDVSLSVERAGVPFLNSTAVSDELATRGLEHFVMPIMSGDTGIKAEIQFVEDLADEIGSNQVAILSESSDYGQAMVASQEKYIDEGGKLEVVEKLMFEAGTGDRSSQVARIKASGAKIVLGTAYLVDDIAIARAWDRLGMDDVHYVAAGGGTAEPDFLETLGPIANGKIVLNTWANTVNEAASEFAQKFREEFGDEPSANSALTYMSTYFLAAALEAAGSTDADEITAAMKETTDQDMPEHARVMQYPIKIDPKTGMNTEAFGVMAQIQNEELVVVWPQDNASAELQLTR